MIRQAVILAAGRGTRLGKMTETIPKGFLNVGGIPIVETSIKKLFAIGVEEIIIGTGHCSEHYEKLAERYPLKLVKNHNYASTGSMGTLACCAEHVNGDILLLESDLIYDDLGLFVIVNDPGSNVILASGRTGSGDEVYLQADGNRFVKHSKKKEELANIYGELVGISKLGKRALEKMVSLNRSDKEYEDALSAISSEENITIRKVENLLWREIDDKDHLKMATENIWPRILESESLRKVRRNVLLNPGPATTTDSVKMAQVQADICPRESEFGDVMRWISEELSSMVGSSERVETVLFAGSGTAGDEIMISSCIPDDGKLLILSNGAYGSRLAKMAEIYRIPYKEMESIGTESPDSKAVMKELISGSYTHFAIVYHETTTGLLNPVPELCRFCHEHGITTIVDAVSAFAAIPIDMDRDCIDFMASTSNKNIQGMAGVTFVFCRKKALEKTSGYRMRNYYLNLWDQYSYFKKTGQMRFTPPVQILYALRQAIIETKIETIEGRYERYSSCWKILMKAVREMGLKSIVPDKDQSKLITAIEEPNVPKYDFEDLHGIAMQNSFTIYPGKLTNAKTFRIANIGDIRPEEMEKFVKVLREYMLGIEAVK